jgi:MFS family permease
VGPLLARWTRQLFDVTYLGSYLCVPVLAVLAGALLLGLRMPPAVEDARVGGHARPLTAIVRQPAFILAVLAQMMGQGVMNLLMTGTPLAMMAHHHSFADTAFVIQWHVVGMYAPSFATGHLIRRHGAPRVILAGTVVMIAAVAVNIGGETLLHYWFGLVLIGMGWNFMFVGGTALLTECHRPEERARVQALNDFLVFGTVSASSFTSGALQHGHGWAVVNLGVVMPILVVFAAAAWLLIHRRRLARKTA